MKRSPRNDPSFRSIAPGETQNCLFERLWVHVVGGCIDEITPQRDAGRNSLNPGGIDTIGNAELRTVAAVGLVAPEPVAGQLPSKRGKCGVIWTIGEAIDAGGKHGR
jgi:hypothetical protein